MKKFSCFLFALFTITIVSCKTSWIGVNIPQSNLVGKKVSGNPKTVGVFQPMLKVVEITSEDAPNSLIRSFEKETKFFLSNIFSTSTNKIADISAKNVKIDYLANYPDAPPSVDFIYSGARADEVYIKYKRDSKTSASAVELLKTISKVRGSLGVVDSLFNLQDTIKFSSSTEYIDTIRNSKVYFIVQVGTIELPNSKIWNRYGKSYSGITNAPNFKLINAFNKEKSILVQPVHLRGTPNSKYVTDTWLQVERNAKNELELYAYYNEVGTNTSTQKQIIPSRKIGDDVVWDVNKFVFYKYPVSKTRYKILSSTVYGKLTDNGNAIEFLNYGNGTYKTFFYYPESDIKFSKY